MARQRPLQPLQEKKSFLASRVVVVKAKEPPIIFCVKKKSGNDFSFKKKIHRDIKLTPKSKAFELILNELHYLSIKNNNLVTVIAAFSSVLQIKLQRSK